MYNFQLTITIKGTVIPKNCDKACSSLDINKYSTNQCYIFVQIDIDVRGEVQKHLPRIFPYMPPFLPPSSTASWRRNPESVVPVLVPLPPDLWWDSILSGS